MDILHILYEGFQGSAASVFKIATIVIPLMVAMQFIKELNFLDRLSVLLSPLVKLLGISRQASLPILAGLFLGLSYGGGIIIQSAREGLLTRRDLFLTVIFLSVCHSLIEDNFLFIAIGADPYILFIGRFVLAVTVTFLVSRLWKVDKKSTPKKRERASDPDYEL